MATMIKKLFTWLQSYMTTNELHIDDQGTKRWYSKGKLHREDGPAVEDVDGVKIWYLNNKLHRTDGPAIENMFGTKQWYLNDKLHRTDGPAIERADGTTEWFLNNKQLKIIPQYILVNYMKVNNYTLAHLLTDLDPLVRESTVKYKWEEAI